MPSSDCETCPSRIESIFCDLIPAKLADLTKAKSNHSYKRGEVVFHEGSIPSGVYCISTGKIKLVKNGEDGNEVILRIHQAGDVLGYRSLLTDEVYAATAKTLEDSEICFVDRGVFLRLIKEDPDLAFKIIRRLGHDLAAAQDRVHDLVSKSVRERLCELLLALGKSHGKDTTDGRWLDIRLSRADIASLIGSAPETIIRLLSSLEEEKMISLQGKKIFLKNQKALTEAAALDF